MPLWVSVGGFSAADYALCCERLDGRRGSPRSSSTCRARTSRRRPRRRPSSSPRRAAATSKTLYAKLSPASWDIAESARAVVAAGADGLSLVNTIRGLALDPVTLRPRLGAGAGGYSGPALRPIALACVYACAEAVDVPIVGMGGVSSGRDALELVAVGRERGRARHGAVRRSARARRASEPRWSPRSPPSAPRVRPANRARLLSHLEKYLQIAENSTA